MSLLKLANAQIKEVITDGKKEIMSINLNYPTFEEGTGKTALKLNEFYSSAAHRYYNFCKNRYAPQLLKCFSEGNKKEIAKNGAVMSYYVSFLNEKLLSIITDISFFDGKERKSTRIVHNRRLSDCSGLRAKEAFKKSSAAKKLYTDEICSKIKNREGNFSYYKNACDIALSHFDFEKFYFTPRGLAFYYDKKLLFDSDSTYPAFIIPYTEVEGICDLCCGK